MPLADRTDFRAPSTRQDGGRRQLDAGTSTGRRLWRLAVRVGGWVAAGYGLVAILAYALGTLLGDRTWYLYIVNLSVIYWLAPAVPLAVLALLVRRWVAAALCGVAAVLWLVTFGPSFVPQPAQAATADLRVASYNVSPQPEVDHVARMVERTQPDIVLIQELLPAAQDALVAAVPSLPHHHFAEVNPAAPGGGGTAVLSRLPLVDARPVEGLPSGSRPIDIVSVDTGGGTLAVTSLHLASPCADCTDDPPRLTGDGLTAEARMRNTEAEQVARALPSGPLVVGGDLNSSTRNTPRRRLLDAGLIDLHRAVGWGPGFTRVGFNAWFRIDWLLASRDVTPVREWVDGQGGSDHQPVVVDVALP